MTTTIPTPPPVPEVITFGPDSGGRRACQFDHDGLVVQVRPTDSEANERAFDYACGLARVARSLADARAHIDQLKARVAKQDAELAALRLRVQPDPVRLLGAGCIRFRDGELWLLNRRQEGWSSFGIRCDGWDDLFRRYNVHVTSTGSDMWGEWWEVENFDADGVARVQATRPEGK
jgi:hypothetical protein